MEFTPFGLWFYLISQWSKFVTEGLTEEVSKKKTIVKKDRTSQIEKKINYFFNSYQKAKAIKITA